MDAVEREAFLQVTLAHLDAVHALARRLVRGQAEDLVQETWLRAYAGWPAGGPQDPRAWLATICLNTARSWHRRDAARPEVLVENPDLGGADQAPDPASVAVDRLRADAVHEALWRLPEAQRVAITLMDLAGFTAREVAELTGAPRGTVLARVHRGRKQLAAHLHRHGPAAPLPGRAPQPGPAEGPA